MINYSGSLMRNGTTLTSTVPTLAQRAGDFSGSGAVIYDPATRLPFPGNRIARMDPIARGLLDRYYIPLPNQPGFVNNYRLVTKAPNNSQSFNARIMQTLSRRDQLSLGVNAQTRDSENVQNFGFVDSSSGHGVNANVNYRHNFGAGRFQNLTGTFNRNTGVSDPFFANGPNVAALLGIRGTSSNPMNFGPPNLNFTNFAGMVDGSPSQNAVYSLGFADTFAIRRGQHNWMLGGGYTRSFNNTFTDANGRGTFTFTGLATSQINANGQPVAGTGLDFADFLLGLPQTNSIRYGGSNTYFRSNSYYVFGQDDFRVLPNLTLNLGLRYEYFAPWREKHGRIANLDIAPNFSAVSVVTPAQPGLYSGAFPSGLMRPDRNNLAPRTALAWKPWTRKNRVVRIGYGIYYNPGIYNQFMSRLAAQPPFAQSTTVNTTAANPLTLETGLTVTPNGKTITNTFAVNPNYQTMYAQTWNAGIQWELPAALVGEINYLGTKGTRLDIQQMPNQAAPGSLLTAQDRLAIGNATGFIYDTPAGNSIYHALQTRLNRRFRRGVSFNLQYTFAKSIDNSSTLGGAGNAVAQNFYNLAAERGLSSFNRRHAFTMNYIVMPPINGSNGLLAGHDVLSAALKDWTLSGGVTVQAGTPLTARVLGNQSDIAGTGTIGSGRAQATGLPVDSGSGFFNLLAFTTPPPGQYGNAGRPITTLKKEDFQLLEDGVAQKITVFDLQQLSSEPLAPMPFAQRPQTIEERAVSVAAGTSVTTPAPGGSKRFPDRRLIGLFFDMSSMQELEQALAREAAIKFIQTQMTAADVVSVMTFGTKFRVVQEFTDDRDLLIATLRRLTLGDASDLAGMAATAADEGDDSGGFAADQTEFNIFNTDRKLTALEDAARKLGVYPEKKALIYFASGVEKTGVENQSQLKATVNAAVRANVSFYPVDARGLVAFAPGGDASVASPRGTGILTGSSQNSRRSSMNDSQETLHTLAADTGGKALLDSNDLTLGIRQAQEDIRSYYTIGYYPANTAEDGKYRRLSIKLPGNAQAKLDYRKGYFAGKTFAKFTADDKERQLEEALALEVDYFRVAKDRYFVPISVKIPGSAVGLAKKGTRQTTDLDFIGQVRDASGRLISGVRDQITVKLSEADAARMDSRHLQYDTGLTVGPGAYSLIFLAREDQTGKMGTFETKFTVPDLNAGKNLRVSSVILSSQKEAVSAAVGAADNNKKLLANHPLVQDGQKVVPSITRVFRKDQMLHVYFEVYDPSIDPDQKAPNVLAAVELIQGARKVISSEPVRATKLATNRPGVMPFSFQIPLARVQPGEYISQVDVIDELGRKFAFPRQSIVVLP